VGFPVTIHPSREEMLGTGHFCSDLWFITEMVPLHYLPRLLPSLTHVYSMQILIVTRFASLLYVIVLKLEDTVDVPFFF
jgi:hypothetical protein